MKMNNKKEIIERVKKIVDNYKIQVVKIEPWSYGSLGKKVYFKDNSGALSHSWFEQHGCKIITGHKMVDTADFGKVRGPVYFEPEVEPVMLSKVHLFCMYFPFVKSDHLLDLKRFKKHAIKCGENFLTKLESILEDAAKKKLILESIAEQNDKGKETEI